MRSITTLALIGLAAVVATGCAVPEQYNVSAYALPSKVVCTYLFMVVD